VIPLVQLISFAAKDLYQPYMNIKATEVHKTAAGTFGKYVYSTGMHHSLFC